MGHENKSSCTDKNHSKETFFPILCNNNYTTILILKIQKLIFSVPKETRLSPICRWKNVFIRVLHLFKNWDKGRYTLPLTLKGHKDQVKAIDCNSKYI